MMWIYVFVRRTEDKKAPYMLHLLETKQRSTTGRKAAVAQMCTTTFWSLPTMLYSFTQNMGVRGEGKTKLATGLPSAIYIVTMCSYTEN